MTSAPTPRQSPAGGFPVVAVVGGGQLARMMQAAAVGLGVRLRLLATADDDSAALVVPDTRLGSHTDPGAVTALVAGVDVLTFDHEHVPPELLRALEARGVAVRPGAAALLHAQDKLVMRERLTALGVAGPRWARAGSPAEVVSFAEHGPSEHGRSEHGRSEHGWPVVLKTPRGGYDGKGVRLLRSPADLAAVEGWFGPAAHPADVPVTLLVEEAVDFVRELAVLVARSPSGQAAAWPVVETVQVDGVCDTVISPAPELDPDLAAAATSTALRLAGELGVTGVLAVEGFETRDGRFLVNELAMRPHNSGHWTIDGAVTSQFEQHLRAVLDLPLGDPRQRDPWCVMVNVLGGPDAVGGSGGSGGSGGVDGSGVDGSGGPDGPGGPGGPGAHADLYRSYLHVMARDPGAKVHMYGKGVRPGRKLGHVTVSGTHLEQVLGRARHAADFIRGVVDE